MEIDPFVRYLWSKGKWNVSILELNNLYRRFKENAEKVGVDPVYVENAFEKVDPSLSYSELVKEMEKLTGVPYEKPEEEYERVLADMLHQLEEEAKALGYTIVKERELAKLKRAEKELEKLRRRAMELEDRLKSFEEAKKKAPPAERFPTRLTAEQVDLLFEEYRSIMTKGLGRGLFPKEIDQFDELVSKVEKMGFEEARRYVRMMAERKVAEAKPAIKPEVAEHPWGLIRVRKVRIAPPIPVWCKVLEHVAHFDEARKRAMELKRKGPGRYYGYAYDPDRFSWAVIECERLPPDAKMDVDGLIYLPAVEKWVREE